VYALAAFMRAIVAPSITRHERSSQPPCARITPT
jgi:hypothetical protein